MSYTDKIDQYMMDRWMGGWMDRMANRQMRGGSVLPYRRIQTDIGMLL